MESQTSHRVIEPFLEGSCAWNVGDELVADGARAQDLVRRGLVEPVRRKENTSKPVKKESKA